VKRARNPFVPPVTPLPPEIPREDVATQIVDVPVDWSTMPRVPTAPIESKRRPARVRFVEEALVFVKLVTLPVVEKRFVMVPFVVEAFVVVAFVVTRCVKLPVTMLASVDQKLVPVRFVVEAFVVVAFVVTTFVAVSEPTVPVVA